MTAVANPMKAFFSPRSIAIVGASGRADNLFARPLRFLVDHGYPGEIYPINPRYDSLLGVRCYDSLASLPAPVDLVLMMVAASDANDQLPAAAAAGASAVITFASGFAEVGVEGRALQDELLSTARQHGLRVLGPNCQGIVAPHSRMSATFTAAVESGLPRAGNVAFVGQSGALGGSVLSMASERGIGIAAWASTGNQADVTALDVGIHLIEDEHVHVLTMYLESPADGYQYEQLATRTRELGKRIVILRAGLSKAGATAAASHTGAIVGGNAEFFAMSAELGVVLADDLDDLVGTMHSLSKLPVARGRRVAVVTTSGGAGSLAADHLEARKFAVEPLGALSQQALSAVVPAFGSVTNPVDVTAQLFRNGTADELVDVCLMVAADDQVDSVLIVLTLVVDEMAKALAVGLADFCAAATKPVLLVWLAAHRQTADARAVLRDAGWPIADSISLAARSLDALSPPSHELTGRSAVLPVAGSEAVIAAFSGEIVTELGGGDLLSLAGIDQPRGSVPAPTDDAGALAFTLGGTVVVKVQSPTVLHKTEVGGVHVGVAAADARKVVDDLRRRFADDPVAAVLVQEMMPSGFDLIVGITRLDPRYPPLITLGAGGIAAELHGDVVSHLAPVSEATVVDMLHRLRSAPLLLGYRGATKFDLEPVARAIARLSQVAVALDDRLIELEINPLRLVAARPAPVALDFLVRLAPAGRRPTVPIAVPITEGAR